MPTDILDDATEVRIRREIIEKRITAIKQALEAEEDNLDKLQKLCPHSNKELTWKDTADTYYYCDNCHRYWRIETKPE